MMTTNRYTGPQWRACEWTPTLKPLLTQPTEMLKDMMMQYHRERTRATMMWTILRAKAGPLIAPIMTQ